MYFVEIGDAMGLCIHMFSAGGGDCFLIDIHGQYILIDGGYYGTFHTILSTQLLQIPRIKLAIITHIDRDHIEGMIELFKYNGHANNPAFVPIDEVWHNSYHHLPKQIVTRELSREDREILLGYISSLPSNDRIINSSISGTQGMLLSSYIMMNGYSWNTATNGAAISKENLSSFHLSSDITITLLAPTHKELSKLAKTWENELRRKKWSFRLTGDVLFNDAMEAFLQSNSTYSDIHNVEICGKTEKSIQELLKISSLPDNSPTNLSSISFLLQAQGKTLLFLADAAEDQIISSMDQMSLNYFDVIKVSHHGSLKNANKLFDYIDSEYFLISTDGMKHQHPDFATIAKIISRPCETTRKLIFNYQNEAYHFFHDTSLMKQYNYSVQKDGVVKHRRLLLPNLRTIRMTPWHYMGALTGISKR